MGRINVNGINLNFESIRVNDPISETVLIFLHEALGSIPQWRSFPLELCQTLRMNGIVYERQGHGKSGPFSDKRDSCYLHNYAVKELPAFIDTLFSADQRFILIGHSDGGSIALLYAAAFPKKIKAIVTMAAHVINESETIAGIEPAVKAFKEGKLDKLTEFHGDKTTELFFAWSDTWSADEFKTWDITNDIRNLISPVLALQGAKDQYGTMKQLELIKENVQGECETALLPECGHHPHLEKMNETIDQIHQWIKLTGVIA